MPGQPQSDGPGRSDEAPQGRADGQFHFTGGRPISSPSSSDHLSALPHRRSMHGTGLNAHHRGGKSPGWLRTYQ